MPVFVLDSNFFIQAHRSYYPIDVVPGFWNKVRQLAEQGSIISIDKVKSELFNGNDVLKEWCRNNLPDDFFKDSSVIMPAYTKVTNWAISRSEHYLPNALNEFLAAYEADAFLVAHCLTDPVNKWVVTQELSDPNRKNKIKLPDACIALGVSYVNTIDMFRKLGETF